MKSKGFTLIELLAVIAIISVLSSIVMVSLNSAKTKAQYGKAKSELGQLVSLITLARYESGKTFRQITGSACTEGSCRNKGNIQLLPKTDPCWIRYNAALIVLGDATGGNMTFPQNISDPWGSPYLFNENEGEGGCYTDNILSPGPDGLWYNSDDIVVNLPVVKCYPDIGPHHPNVNWDN